MHIQNNKIDMEKILQERDALRQLEKNLSENPEMRRLFEIFGGSQKEFGKLLGVPQSQISIYVNGRVSISVNKLREYCDKVGVDIKEVI